MKNKAPAPIQITAEQLLREAASTIQQGTKAPKQRISDKQELEEYRYKKKCVLVANRSDVTQIAHTQAV